MLRMRTFSSRYMTRSWFQCQLSRKQLPGIQYLTFHNVAHQFFLPCKKIRLGYIFGGTSTQIVCMSSTINEAQCSMLLTRFFVKFLLSEFLIYQRAGGWWCFFKNHREFGKIGQISRLLLMFFSIWTTDQTYENRTIPLTKAVVLIQKQHNNSV